MKKAILAILFFWFSYVVYGGGTDFLPIGFVPPLIQAFPHHKQHSPSSLSKFSLEDLLKKQALGSWLPSPSQDQLETMPEEVSEVEPTAEQGFRKFRPSEITFVDSMEAITTRIMAKLEQHWFQPDASSSISSGTRGYTHNSDYSLDEQLAEREKLLKRANSEDSFKGELEENRRNAESRQTSEDQDDTSSSLSQLTDADTSDSMSPPPDHTATDLGKPDTSTVYDGNIDSLLNKLGTYTYQDSKNRIHTTKTVDEGAASSASGHSNEEANIDCSVCLEVINDPYSFCGTEKHSVCLVCAQESRKYGRINCPSCRRQGAIRPSIKLRETINSIKVKCPFDECPEAVAIRDIVNHTDHCPRYPKQKEELLKYDRRTQKTINERLREKYLTHIYELLESNLDESQKQNFLSQLGYAENAASLPFRETILSTIAENTEKTFSQFLLILIAINANKTIDKILSDFSFLAEDAEAIRLAQTFSASELLVHIESAFPLWSFEASRSIVSEFIAALEEMQNILFRDRPFYALLLSKSLISDETYRQAISPSFVEADQLMELFYTNLEKKLGSMNGQKADQLFRNFIELIDSYLLPDMVRSLMDRCIPLNLRLNLFREYADPGQLATISLMAASKGLITFEQKRLLSDPENASLMLTFMNAMKDIAEKSEEIKDNAVIEEKIITFYQDLDLCHRSLLLTKCSERLKRLFLSRQWR